MAAGIAGAAAAQTAPATTTATTPDKSTEVVVVGVRRSLKTSQQIKRDADTVVDSITATDIGAFPDKSVAEALQRVAGITVSRFAASTDTAHFSAEPSSVLVRGLTQVRSEFNGRDTFSANSSRGLDWGDVSPELMAGVDTYKNQTADMIEGGLAGTIDLRTRLPFDSKGQVIALSADAAYNENGNKTTPDLSGIYTNRWATQYGEFGLMLNGAASDVQTRSEGVQEGRDGVFAPSVFGTSGNTYIPTTVAYHDNNYTRKRTGIAAAGQWQNNDHTMVATLQYNNTSYDNSWKENIVTGDFFATWQDPVTTVFNTPYTLAPDTGTSAFTFNNNGMFLTGTPGSDYFGQTGVVGNPTGTPEIASCNSWTPAPSGAAGSEATCGRLAAGLTTSTRYADTKEQTEDESFNFKWDVTDRLKTNFDVQYVFSTVHDYDMTADLETYQNIALNLSGKYPTMSFSTPENVTLQAGGLTNPSNYRYNDLMDHTEDDKGHELSTRFDVQYQFAGDGWLSSLKAGVRYADREQEIMWSNYNWGGMQSVWSGQNANAFITGPNYPQDVYGVHNFGNNLLGGGLLSSNSFVFIDMNAIKDRTDFANALTNSTANNNGGSWTALCNRPSLIPGTCYQESEVNHVSEKTTAAYAMLKFGGKDKVLFGNITLDGNIGIRWVQTVDTSTGFVQIPTSDSWTGTLTCVTTGPTAQPADEQPGCLIGTSSATDLNNAVTFYGAGAGVPLSTKATHINSLPSLNLKFGITDKWLIRFAAAEGMSRPDMGYLKNYLSISAPTISTATNCAQISACTQNSAGQNVDFNPELTAQAGNPNLKSTTADMFDLTAEDYFASDGYFSFDLFYKKFHNYIQTGKFAEAITNNGVTEDVVVTGPVNDQGASVKGFEVSFQRFFDFLPGYWSGLGVQANYTHLVQNGVNNSNLTEVSGNGSETPVSSASGLGENLDSINPKALEGMSNDSYNLIGMYEKGPWALRLAYNWRSQFLLTSLDCCVGLPIWQKQQGLLDGSIRYKINENIELSLEGTNILGSDTRLDQQVAGDTASTPNAARVLMPDAWFKNDRRFQVGIRLKY
jgi:iron complex outermembrane receptor protein